jgi:hypothetical protein
MHFTEGQMSQAELLAHYLGRFQHQTSALFLVAIPAMDKERALLLFFRLYLQ